MTDKVKDNWRHRRRIIYISLFSGIAMGLGLFLVETAKAAVIAGAITTIALTLFGIATTYTAGAVADDHSKRIHKDVE